jgi:hypothetical protein
LDVPRLGMIRCSVFICFFSDQTGRSAVSIAADT